MVKVLIVDNETAIRQGLAHCIQWESLGCVIVGQAADGIEALEQAENLRPDIVISDIRMPEMDGLELAKRLNLDYPDIKVIILTGYPYFSYAQKAVGFGVVDFVLKPTSVEHLTDAILLAKKKIEENRSRYQIQRQLAHQSEQNIKLQRSLFIRDLIFHNKLSHLYVLSRIRELGLDISTYLVICIYICLPNIKEEDLDFIPMQEEATGIFSSVLHPLPFYFSSTGSPINYVLVGRTGPEDLLARCTKAIEIIDGLLRYSISIGISNVYNDPLHISHAAKEARQAQQFAAYSADSSAVGFQNIPLVSRENFALIGKYIGRLRDTIVQNQPEAACTLLTDIFDVICSVRLPMPEVHKIASFIYYSCVDLAVLRDVDEALYTILPIDQVLVGSSLEELKKKLKAFMLHILKDNSCLPDDMTEAVRVVQQYICLHYRENMTLETLAKLVYLSPSYLSKLFKRQTGETIVSYIHAKRIEKAKHLLLSTPLKSYEVGEQVGITDAVYFSRLFKKVVGVNPRDYRGAHNSQKQG